MPASLFSFLLLVFVFFKLAFYLSSKEMQSKFSLVLYLEVVHRREEEALLTADAYRVAFEQQLAKNSSLIYELLEKSRWKKKISFPGRRKDIATGENGLKNEEEELVQQIKAHKDDIVAKLLGMVSVYKKKILQIHSSWRIFG